MTDGRTSWQRPSVSVSGTKIGDTIVLMDKEFHAGEPGWHCHFTSKKVDSAVAGVARAGKRRWPRGADPKAEFGVTEAGALSIAAEMFQFGASGPLV